MLLILIINCSILSAYTSHEIPYLYKYCIMLVTYALKCLEYYNNNDFKLEK